MSNTSISDWHARLSTAEQSHLLQFWERLDATQRASLLAQLDSIDWASVPRWVATYVKNKPRFEIPSDLEPAPCFTRQSPCAPALADAGRALLKAGKVAAFVVAGGQGSRLGFDGPKGCYPATAITSKSLFQLFAEQLLAARHKYGVIVPWYIMTSPLNHRATVEFFARHRFFGLGEDNVRFFPQGVMPSFDISTGKILLAGPGEIATNPDGHGGAVAALHKSGSLADMRRRGIEHLAYFQVDNPHVQICDELFLGLHAQGPGSSGEMSSKMVAKASWDEKVGVFCLANGRLDVIEYSDLPQDLAKATDPSGRLRFNAGSIAIHALSVAFLERLATDPAFELPFHRAEKKVPHVDPVTGLSVEPAANNGVKLERFIFDALAKASQSVVLETDRVEEFAPIKNATGADSVVTSQKLQTLRATRWLSGCGTSIPTTPAGEPDCIIELSPLTACAVGDVACVRMPSAIERGARVLL